MTFLNRGPTDPTGEAWPVWIRQAAKNRLAAIVSAEIKRCDPGFCDWVAQYCDTHDLAKLMAAVKRNGGAAELAQLEGGYLGHRLATAEKSGEWDILCADVEQEG